MEPTQGFVEVIEFKELEFYEVNNCIQIITNVTSPVLDFFHVGETDAEMGEFNVRSIDSSLVTMKTHIC